MDCVVLDCVVLDCIVLDCVVLDCIAFAVGVYWVCVLFLGFYDYESKIGVFCDGILLLSCGVAVL